LHTPSPADSHTNLLPQPWQAKKEYFDLYPLSNITVAKHKVAPIGMPDIAYASCDSKSPWQPIPDEGARLARRAYYASVSGMDAQVGRLLAHLESKGSAVFNSTVVILHGDHGWQLGEYASTSIAPSCMHAHLEPPDVCARARQREEYGVLTTYQGRRA